MDRPTAAVDRTRDGRLSTRSAADRPLGDFRSRAVLFRVCDCPDSTLTAFFVSMEVLTSIHPWPRLRCVPQQLTRITPHPVDNSGDNSGHVRTTGSAEPSTAPVPPPDAPRERSSDTPRRLDLAERAFSTASTGLTTTAFRSLQRTTKHQRGRTTVGPGRRPSRPGSAASDTDDGGASTRATPTATPDVNVPEWHVMHVRRRGRTASVTCPCAPGSRDAGLDAPTCLWFHRLFAAPEGLNEVSGRARGPRRRCGLGCQEPPGLGRRCRCSVAFC